MIDPKIEMLARMWMVCDPNRGGDDADGPIECRDTPLTGKPKWHWFIPRAEASLNHFEDAGYTLENTNG